MGTEMNSINKNKQYSGKNIKLQNHVTKIKNNVHETFDNQNDVKMVKKRKSAKKEEVKESKKSFFGRKEQQNDNHLKKVTNIQDAANEEDNIMILFAWGICPILPISLFIPKEVSFCLILIVISHMIRAKS